MAVCSVLGAVSVLEVAAPREQLGGLGADRLGDGRPLAPRPCGQPPPRAVVLVSSVVLVLHVLMFVKLN